MTRVLLICFLASLIQISLCQVIANSPYYSNMNSYGLTNTVPIANTQAASPLNGIPSNSLAMANPVANAVYSTIPNEPAIGSAVATTAAINAANSGLTAGVTGLEGFSLGGIPMSGVSPMGYGDVTILGELPVGGSTGVTGNVPVIGYVTFEGTVPAGGTVTLASNCGCSNPTIF